MQRRSRRRLPKPAAVVRAEALLGVDVVEWSPVARGYTQHERWLVHHRRGSAFVKAAVDADSRLWLRRELRVYADVRGRFLPRLLAADPEVPLLVLEDLSDAVWPPPWSAERVAAVLTALDDIAATTPAAGLASLEAQRERFDGWSEIARDPAPFLSLGLASPRWLEESLPALRDATRAAPLGGHALVHGDVRSDNICLREGRALLIDWNEACVGNALFDLACWLPSLAMEGGPTPEEVVPNRAGLPELAAVVAGYFASRAGLPRIQRAPGVRPLQLAQLRVALPWAARLLGLPEP